VSLQRGPRQFFVATVTDGYGRYLLGCQALSSTAVNEAKPVFTRLFKQFGLPKRIRTDNGVPFATSVTEEGNDAGVVDSGMVLFSVVLFRLSGAVQQHDGIR
jgi:hypothetical protein